MIKNIFGQFFIYGVLAIGILLFIFLIADLIYTKNGKKERL
jgi:hypothetical protein